VDWDELEYGQTSPCTTTITEPTKLHEIKHKSNHRSDQTVILESK
jgi:hypothetical protein